MEETFYVIIYQLFAWIDYIVYSFAAVLVRIILLIANKDDFFTPTQINEFVGRVYVVVGVLVLFKLVISAVQYMINPDTFDDKDKGMGGVLQRVAISLALVVVAPTIFNFLMHIQTSIVSTLPMVIFGNNITEVDELTKDTASNLSFTVLSSFVSQNGNKGAPIGSSSGIHDLESFADKIVDGCYGKKNFFEKVLSNAWDQMTLKPWGRILGITSKDGAMADCNYNYKIIASTAAGAFLCYVLLSMTLDVSIRFIKLGVIRMLAPIPIVGYIFSKDKLSKFVKTAGTVYLDLFIRMGIIYFIVFFISEIIGSGAGTTFNSSIKGFFGITSGDNNPFFNAAINIAIIFGLLMFAKNAPKFISDLLGLPDVGSGDLADMFKPAWQRAGGAAGQLINPVSNAVSNWRQARGMGRSVGESLRRAAAGFGKGALDSVEGMMAGDDWAKMRARHDNAARRSLERATTAKNKERNRQNSDNRIKTLQDRIRSLKEKMGWKDDKALRQEAENNYNNEKTKLRNTIDRLGNNIQRGIDNGTLTGKAKEKAINRYNALKARLSDLENDPDGKNKEAYIKDQMYKIQAKRDLQNQINGYKSDIASNNARIGYIDQQIAQGGLTADQRIAYETEKSDLQAKNAEARKAIDEITRDSGIQAKTAAIRQQQKEIGKIDDILAGRASNATLDGFTTQENDIRNNYAAQIAEIESQYGTAPSYKVNELIAKKNALIQQRETELAQVASQRQEYMNTLTSERESKVQARAQTIVELKGEYDAKQAKVNKVVNEYMKIDKEIADTEQAVVEAERQKALVEEGIRSSGWRATVDAYFGGSPVSGKGYLELADLLGKRRSDIYTGESMRKMREKADILVDDSGQEVKFKTNFAEQRVAYSKMLSIYTRYTSSGLTEDLKREIGEIGLDSSMIESAFKEVEKEAAAAYYTATVEEMLNPAHAEITDPNDPRYVDTTFGGKYPRIRLKRHEINSAIQEDYSTFEDALVKLGVPGNIIGKILADYRKNPGDFMKKASTEKDLYSIVGKYIVDASSPKDGNK